MKAITLTTESVLSEIDSITYETLRDAVGGYIECVPLSLDGVELDMWVNEEGKLTGLPTNDQATLLYIKTYGPRDIIKGNVIFTGGTDARGDTTPLSARQAQVLVANLVDLFAVTVTPWI